MLSKTENWGPHKDTVHGHNRKFCIVLLSLVCMFHVSLHPRKSSSVVRCSDNLMNGDHNPGKFHCNFSSSFFILA
jgi:hypothetical protein